MANKTSLYLIWSFEHGAWWAPAGNGYVQTIEQAGRYTAVEAGKIVTDSIWLDEVAILLEQVVARWGNKPPKYHPYNGAAENDDA